MRRIRRCTVNNAVTFLLHLVKLQVSLQHMCGMFGQFRSPIIAVVLTWLLVIITVLPQETVCSSTKGTGTGHPIKLPYLGWRPPRSGLIGDSFPILRDRRIATSHLRGTRSRRLRVIGDRSTPDTLMATLTKRNLLKNEGVITDIIYILSSTTYSVVIQCSYSEISRHGIQPKSIA